MPPWRTTLAMLCAGISLYAASRSSANSQYPLANDERPNIVFILTDDQDLHMDSLEYMPHTRRLIGEQGTSHTHHFCTVALCCPSRASIWTGKAAHNHNITDVNPPHGGYPKFISQGFNSDYLPLWLQAAGYNTYYIGKLFNAHKVTNYDKPFVSGWTSSDFLLDPYTYEYVNATFQRDRDVPVSYEGQYSTDIVGTKSLGFLDDAVAAAKPFLLTIAPIAPHSNVHFLAEIDGNYSGAASTQSPPVPAARHAHLFADVKVLRALSFNPDTPSGAAWISRLPQQNVTNIAYNDEWYRNRLRALQAVDEMVEQVVDRLATAGVLDNTYIIYTTDNGYHIGQHRLQPGKQCAYREDTNIPFIVRGPGVPRNFTTDLVSTHTDLAATFLDIAGAAPKSDLDGDAIPLTAAAIMVAKADRQRGEHVGIEMWGIIMSEGAFGAELYRNHTYKALRVVGEGYNVLYTVWCNGEHELYDLMTDPYELHNISPILSTSDHAFRIPATASETAVNSTLQQLVNRLDALLVVLKTCEGRTCTHPYETLHPSGGVNTLRDALASTFDAYYERIDKLAWAHCEEAYIPSSELPHSLSYDVEEGYMWHEASGL